MIASDPGVSSAPPMPCTTRAAISTRTFGARPHSSEAAANQVTPIRNTRRRPNRSPSEPPSRISEARLSEYPLTVHCKEAAEAWKSVPMCGSATFTTVMSMNVSAEPSTVASSTHRPAGSL